MFELEPIYGSTPVYASWDTSSSAVTTLSNLQSCLATSDTGGIGRFSVYLPTSATSPLGSYAYAVQAWGQNLIGSSSSSIVSASMPLGWYDVIDSQPDPMDGSMVYRVTYYTGSPADYIRPNFDPGTFSLGLSNVAAPAGNGVLFFNDANNTNPANPSTFPAIVYPGATAASGFDATLAVNIVPEPGSAVLCFTGFCFAVILRWHRRRKAKHSVRRLVSAVLRHAGRRKAKERRYAARRRGRSSVESTREAD